MKRIAIAGGIGAGKTVVTDYLAERGWTVIDADLIAHQLSQPEGPVWRALRDAFGDAVVRADATLDRAFIADIVFHDASALRRLNRITHAPIGVEIARQLGQVTAPAAFVALPLFRPEHRAAFDFDSAWSVQVAPETAVRRLCAHRGYSEVDAQRRLANQMTNDERKAIVDRVMWNEGSIDELYRQVDALLREEGLVDG